MSQARQTHQGQRRLLRKEEFNPRWRNDLGGEILTRVRGGFPIAQPPTLEYGGDCTTSFRGLACTVVPWFSIGVEHPNCQPNSQATWSKESSGFSGCVEQGGRWECGG